MIEAELAKGTLSVGKIAHEVGAIWKLVREPSQSSFRAFIAEIKDGRKIDNNVLKLSKKK